MLLLTREFFVLVFVFASQFFVIVFVFVRSFWFWFSFFVINSVFFRAFRGSSLSFRSFLVPLASLSECKGVFRYRTKFFVIVIVFVQSFWFWFSLSLDSGTKGIGKPTNNYRFDGPTRPNK